MVSAGPSRNVNLSYVLLGRALHHQRVVALRTHAHRDRLTVRGPEGAGWVDALGHGQRSGLERCLSRLRDGQDAAAVADELAARLEPVVAAVDEASGAGASR